MSVCLGKFTDQTCRRPVPAPTDHDIEALALRLAQRLGKLARRRFEQASEELETLDTDTLPLRSVSAEAIQIPGPRAPRHQTDIFGEGPPDDQGVAAPGHKPLCARVQGFSLHAARVVESSDRDGLERLCRYGLRAPFSQDRLSLTQDGQV
ncbi:MAG TPA: transposase, partial [Myxococcota bacterium]|nr:transposase [Myxococcota bacterium]